MFRDGLACGHKGARSLRAAKRYPRDDLAVDYGVVRVYFEGKLRGQVVEAPILKLDETGRPAFLDLMRGRGPFSFVAFDLLLVASGTC